MAILIYAEHSDGALKKGALEAATYATDLARQHGNLPVHAVVLGSLPESEYAKLARHGVSAVHVAEGQEIFNSLSNTAAVVAAAQACQARFVVLPQSYNGRALAPGVAVKLGFALFSGVSELPTAQGNGLQVRRIVYSNKGVQHLSTQLTQAVFTVKPNGYSPVENPVSGPSVAPLSFEAPAQAAKQRSKALNRRSGEISLTEAEVVVSAGRGLKGPENWGMIEELASLLGAATACSKPVADVHWRPHHEHVGQTGIQIAPNVYIAVGISGAIQHLAGVSASKTIIVINKDPEAPFFKAADIAIVGDAFEVVPKLISAVKAHKAAA